MKEESLGELTPRAEPKDTIDGEGFGMYGENLTSKETIKAFRGSAFIVETDIADNQ